MTDDLVALLSRLIAADLEFVVVGGVAAFMHGSDQLTRDLDILAVFTPANMTRLLAALHDLHPYNSARPDLGELHVSPEELARYRNLYLGTDLGRLDVLGEIPPLSGYAEVATQAIETKVPGGTCKLIGLDHLITIKESIGRPRDRIAAAELKAIRDRLRNPPRPPSGDNSEA